jgi:glyoxylase-like metal-dependent hydrolase (beta-lactamase superfamily II)
MSRHSSVRLLERGLWLVEASLDDLDVRGALIVGRDSCAIFDTLAHPDHMMPVNRLIRGSWFTAVYSHGDWDHVWGTGGLLRPPDQILAHHDCHECFEVNLPRQLTNKRVEDDWWNAVSLVRPTHTFGTEHTVDLGGPWLDLHHLPGHTADSVVGWLPEWGTLLAGDAVETPLPLVNDGALVTQWIEGLKHWSADSHVRVVVPAHGPLGGREMIDHNIEYLEGLLEGRDQPPASPLTEFYQKAHRANLERIAAARDAN